MLELAYPGIDVLKPGVALGVLAAFLGLAVALQAVAQALEQPPHRAGTDRMPSTRQLPGQARRALARPAQGRLRVSARDRIDQGFQSGEQARVGFGSALAARSRTAQSRRQRGGRVSCPRLEFCQAFGDRVGRQSRHAMERTHAAPAVGPGFGGGPLPPPALIHQRGQGGVTRRNGLQNHSFSHPSSSSTINVCSTYFDAPPKHVQPSKSV